MTGTTVTFVPDFSIFQSDTIDLTHLSQHLRELAYLVPGLTITLEDQRSNKGKYILEFVSKGGVSDFVRYLNRGYTVLHEPITIRQTVELKRNHQPLGFSGTFDIAFQYADTDQPVILSFMNGVELECVGSQITGLIDSLWAAIINPAIKTDHEMSVRHHGFTNDDCLRGLAAVLSLRHPEPKSCNSLYYILDSPEVEDAVSRLVWDAMSQFADQFPDQITQLIDRCLANKTRRLERRYRE